MAALRCEVRASGAVGCYELFSFFVRLISNSLYILVAEIPEYPDPSPIPIPRQYTTAKYGMYESASIITINLENWKPVAPDNIR